MSLTATYITLRHEPTRRSTPCAWCRVRNHACDSRPKQFRFRCLPDQWAVVKERSSRVDLLDYGQIHAVTCPTSTDAVMACDCSHNCFEKLLLPAKLALVLVGETVEDERRWLSVF